MSVDTYVCTQRGALFCVYTDVHLPNSLLISWSQIWWLGASPSVECFFEVRLVHVPLPYPHVILPLAYPRSQGFPSHLWKYYELKEGWRSLTWYNIPSIKNYCRLTSPVIHPFLKVVVQQLCGALTHTGSPTLWPTPDINEGTESIPLSWTLL